MQRKIFFLFCILFFSGIGNAFCQRGKEAGFPENVLMFRGAPNPCRDKCLIRTYLPQNDPFATIRILNTDSVLVKEVPMGAETGVSSALFDVSDLDNGKYYYQLYYKGEIYYTYRLVVKH